MEHVTEFLSDFVDGKLTEAEKRQVDAHLSGCQACRQELAEIMSVSKMVAELPQKPLPTGFMERLRKRHKAKGGNPSIFDKFWRWMKSDTVRPMAYAFCAIAVMILVFRSQEFIRLTDSITTRSFASRTGRLNISIVPYNIHMINARAYQTQAASGSAGGAVSGVANLATTQKRAEVSSANGGTSINAMQQTANRQTPGQLRSSSAQGKQAPAPNVKAAAQSKLHPHYTFVIRSQKELKAVWHQNHMTEAPPVVDFSQYMVIFIHAKVPGARVEISDIRQDKYRILVLYTEVFLNVVGKAPIPYAYSIIPSKALPVVFQAQQ